MFCPKCGLALVQEDGTWRCASGGLELTARLARQLVEQYPDAQTAPPPVHPERSRGAPASEPRVEPGRLYCPGCGVPLDAKKSCPECGKSLRKHLFALTELHPHWDGKGSWK